MAIKTSDEYVIPISVKDDVTKKLKDIENAVASMLGSLKGTGGGVSSGLEKIANTANKAGKAMGEAGRSAKTAKEGISIFGMTLTGLHRTIFIANAYLDFFNRTIRTFQTVVGSAIAPAMGLEAGLSKISTVLPEGTNLLGKMKEEIIGFQKTYGSDQQALISGYYELLQSGAVEAAEATQVMDTAQRMAVAGFSTTDKMITGLVSVLANYNMKAIDTVRIADLMAIANVNGRVSIEGLAENIGMVAGLANNMNISLEETFAAMSTISMATSSSAEAMTSFRAIITGLSTQTGEFSNVMRKLGFNSIQAMIAQKGFMGTINALINEAGLSAEALSNIFGRVEAKVGLTALTAEKTSKVFQKNIADMDAALGDIGGKTDEMFAKAMNNSEKKFNLLIQRIKAMMSEIGIGLVESLNRALDSVISSLEKVDNFFKIVIKTYKDLEGVTNLLSNATIILAQAVTALGIAYAILNFKSIIAGFSNILSIVKKLAVALMTNAAALLAVTGQFILIGGAIFGVIVAIETMYKNWEIAAVAFDVGILKILVSYYDLKIAAKETYNEMIDSLNKLGLVSDSVANTLRLNTNKDIESQKIFNDGLLKSKVYLSNLGKDFKAPAIVEFFRDSKTAMDKFNDNLNATKKNMTGLGKITKDQLSKQEKFIPVIKPETLDARLPLNEAISSMSVDDSFIGEFIGLYSAIDKEYQNYHAVERKNYVLLQTEKHRRDELTRSIIEAEKKYYEAFRQFQLFLNKELKSSQKETIEISFRVFLKDMPKERELIKLEKEMLDFSEKTLALEMAYKNMLPDVISKKREMVRIAEMLYDFSLKNPEQIGQKVLGYEIKRADLQKKELDAAKSSLNVSLQKSSLLKFELEQRKNSIKYLEQEKDLLRESMKYEEMMANIKKEGGFAAFGEEQLLQVGKSLDKPIERIGKTLSDSLILGSDQLLQVKESLEVAPDTFMGKVGKSLYESILDAGSSVALELGVGLADVTDGMDISGGLASFTSFMAGPLGMVSAASMIIDGLTDIVNMIGDLPNKVAGLLDAIINLPAKLAEGLANIVTNVGRIFSEFIPNIGKMIVSVLDFVPDLIMSIFDGVINMISGDLFSILGEAVGKLFAWIPRVIIRILVGVIKLVPTLFKMIPKILKDFLTSFVDVFKEMINELSNALGFGDVFKIQAKLDPKSIKSIEEQFDSSAQQMFSVTDIEPKKKDTTMLEKLSKAMNDFVKKSRDYWKWIMDKLWALWNWVRNKILMPIMNGIISAWKWVWDSILSPIISAIRGIWLWVLNDIILPIPKAIASAFEWIVANVIDPIVNSFVNMVAWLINGVFKPILSGISSVFKWVFNMFGSVSSGFKSAFAWIVSALTSVVGFFKDVFANLSTWWKGLLAGFDAYIIQPIAWVFRLIIDLFDNLIIKPMHGIGEFFMDIFNTIIHGFQGVFEFIKIAFTTFTSIFTTVIDGVKPLFELIGSVFGKIGSIFSGIGSSIGEAFNGISFSKFGEAIGEGFSKIFSPIFDAVKSLGNVFVDLINGLKIPKMEFGIKYIGNVKLWDEIDIIPGEIARFATGGMAMGTDTIPAMLTPGEFIVNRNATSKNIDLLRNINAGREPITAGGSNPVFNITINAKTMLDQDSIKREILPTVERELKRKSLDGSFVLSASGIRK